MGYSTEEVTFPCWLNLVLRSAARVTEDRPLIQMLRMMSFFESLSASFAWFSFWIFSSFKTFVATSAAAVELCGKQRNSCITKNAISYSEFEVAEEIPCWDVLSDYRREVDSERFPTDQQWYSQLQHPLGEAFLGKTFKWQPSSTSK